MDDATWEEDFLERLGQEESEPEEEVREEQQQPQGEVTPIDSVPTPATVRSKILTLIRALTA